MFENISIILLPMQLLKQAASKEIEGIETQEMHGKLS